MEEKGNLKVFLTFLFMEMTLGVHHNVTTSSRQHKRSKNNDNSIRYFTHSALFCVVAYIGTKKLKLNDMGMHGKSWRGKHTEDGL